MSKKKLTLSINEDLIYRTKKYEINLSSFLEIRLQEHLALLEGKSFNNNSYSKRKSSDKKQNNDKSGAYGLVVMTSPSHGGGRRFESG